MSQEKKLQKPQHNLFCLRISYIKQNKGLHLPSCSLLCISWLLTTFIKVLQLLMYSLLRPRCLLAQPSFFFLPHLTTDSQITVNELPTSNFRCLLPSLCRTPSNHFRFIQLSADEEQGEERGKGGTVFCRREASWLLIGRHQNSQVTCCVVLLFIMSLWERLLCSGPCAAKLRAMNASKFSLLTKVRRCNNVKQGSPIR